MAWAALPCRPNSPKSSASLPHVTVASPVISNFSMSGNVEILYGIDYPSFNALKPFVFLIGRALSGAVRRDRR